MFDSFFRLQPPKGRKGQMVGSRGHSKSDAENPEHAAAQLAFSRLKTLPIANGYKVRCRTRNRPRSREVASWKILQETKLRGCPGIHMQFMGVAVTKRVKIIQPLYSM